MSARRAGTRWRVLRGRESRHGGGLETGCRAAQAGSPDTLDIPAVTTASARARLGLGHSADVATLTVELGPKQLEVLRELVPTATIIALLVNPTNTTNAETLSRDLQSAARTIGLQLHVLHASTERDFDAVFESLPRLRAGALVIGSDPFFNSRSQQLAALALRHAIPTMYPFREYAMAGGLISYGNSFADAHRQAGIYTGKILNGEKPGDLPVQQSTRVELIINLKTAKALGLNIPNTLIGRADEVIE